MPAAPLEDVEHHRADLAADGADQRPLQNLSDAGVATRPIAGLGHIAAVGELQPLRYHDHNGTFLFHRLLYVVDELPHGEGHLRQVDQMGGVFPKMAGQNGGGGEPAAFLAHDLYDSNRADGIGLRVPDDFLGGGGDKLGRGAEAGGMVGAAEVVVHRFGDAQHLDILLLILQIAGELPDRIHGVGAADVQKIADIVAMENFYKLFVNLGVVFRRGQLKPAGAQSHAGGCFQQLKILRGADLAAQIRNLLGDDAVYSVGSAIYFIYLRAADGLH